MEGAHASELVKLKLDHDDKMGKLQARWAAPQTLAMSSTQGSDTSGIHEFYKRVWGVVLSITV